MYFWTVWRMSSQRRVCASSRFIDLKTILQNVDEFIQLAHGQVSHVHEFLSHKHQSGLHRSNSSPILEDKTATNLIVRIPQQTGDIASGAPTCQVVAEVANEQHGVRWEIPVAADVPRAASEAKHHYDCSTDARTSKSHL